MFVSYNGMIQKVVKVIESHEHLCQSARYLSNGTYVKSLKQSYDSGFSVMLYHTKDGCVAQRLT